jgi:hypothetical protein
MGQIPDVALHFLGHFGVSHHRGSRKAAISSPLRTSRVSPTRAG